MGEKGYRRSHNILAEGRAGETYFKGDFMTEKIMRWKSMTVFLTAALTVMLTLYGCKPNDISAADTAEPTLSADAADAAEPTIGDDETIWVNTSVHDEEAENIYAFSNSTVFDIKNEEIVFCTADPRDTDTESTDGIGWIYQAAGTEDRLFALIGRDGGYVLTVMDRQEASSENPGHAFQLSAAQDIDTINGWIGTNSSALGIYQGKLYLLYTFYNRENENAWELHAYCYERQPDGSYVKSQDELCTTIMSLKDQGYEICGREQDLFTCLNERNFLVMQKQEEAKISVFGADGTLLLEYPVDPAMGVVEGTDGRFLIGIERRYGRESQYYIYDLAEADADRALVKNGIFEGSHCTYLGLHDGYVYYYREEGWAYSRYVYSVYRYDRNAAGEEEFLFETADLPGQPILSNISSIFVRDDSCYFMYFDDGSLWWYSCDLTEEQHPLTRHGQIEEYLGFYDMGEISYQSESFICPECGEMLYENYEEQVRLYEDIVPYADVINSALEEKEAFDPEGEWRYYVEETDCEDHKGECYYEWCFGGATQFAFDRTGQDNTQIYLEVEYWGDYCYIDGRPQQLRGRYYFDLMQGGSEVAIGDILGISEEEFRALVAEYTVTERQKLDGISPDVDTDTDADAENETDTDADVETDTDTDTDTDTGASWDDLYHDVYEHIGFDGTYDCSIYLSEEGVVLEYSPFAFESFETGYFKVVIPYDEMGLTLQDIYGRRAD